jgi:transcriptional regulator with XRE-family HTH domain
MITNERQYKITRHEAEKFRSAIADLTKMDRREGVHPRLLQAEREGLESQLHDLEIELQEYEGLKTLKPPVITVSSFDELAEGLIKARIAAGLSQKGLADRLGLKEQQIQRYEAERYGAASYQRMREIAAAIGVRIRNDILLPMKPGTFEGLVTKLRQVGLERDFLFTCLLSSDDAARARGEAPTEDDASLAAKAGSALERIYGWTYDNLFGAQPLDAPRFAAAEGRFKMPARRPQAAANLFIPYANYLAVIVLNACRDLPRGGIPTDPKMMRRAIVDSRGDVDLRAALHFAWDQGIPVLPLRNRGTFHGACWRYEHRNVVVLKQRSKHEARWLFDLLHELFHAGQRPGDETMEVLEAEETSVERRTSDEEIAASQFAGDVSLDNRAGSLAEACVQLAGGSVERLKGVVPRIAEQAHVGVGALANYMAFRLSWQGINWWGTAANLQADDGDPWVIARDVFIERFPFRLEDELDRALLDRVLH